MATSATKIWFVTGGSAGLGRSMVEHILQQGAKVAATVRKPETLSDLASKYPSQLLVITLEVTSPTDIVSAFAKAIEHFGRIDVVYNNAGVIAIAEVEGTPDEVARSQFEINFWGSSNVAREAIRVFRDVNKPPGGRLLQASTLNAVRSLPTLGYYNATKWAVEGLSEALSKELHPSWNIKVTILQLGAFATRALGSGRLVNVAVPAHPAYDVPDSVTTAVRGYLTGPALALGDADKAAREIFKIAGDDTVGLRVPLGPDAIANIKEKIADMEKTVETTEKWSVDLK